MVHKLEAGEAFLSSTLGSSSSSPQLLLELPEPPHYIMPLPPGRAPSQTSEQQLPEVHPPTSSLAQGAVVDFCRFYHWVISTYSFFLFWPLNTGGTNSYMKFPLYEISNGISVLLTGSWKMQPITAFTLSTLNIFLLWTPSLFSSQSFSHPICLHLPLQALHMADSSWLGLCSTVTSSERPPLTSLFKGISQPVFIPLLCFTFFPPLITFLVVLFLYSFKNLLSVSPTKV